MTYSGQFNSEMGEKHLLGALPLLCGGRNFGRLEFPLLKVRNGVDDDPRNTASEIHNLVVNRCQNTMPSAGCATYFV